MQPDLVQPTVIDAAEWRERCARRMTEIESDLSADEVQSLAEDFHAFERIRAMVPEDAVDFVASEMNRPDHSRFERRVAPRA